MAKACRVILDRRTARRAAVTCLLLRCMAEAPGIEHGVLDNHLLYFGRASGSPASGGLSSPLRMSFTPLITDLTAMRTSS